MMCARARRPGSDERGTVLVHVAVMMVGVLAFGALVLDYGVMWVARRQAQNAADAGALAAANIVAFYRSGEWALAREAAKKVAEGHKIFGIAPTVTLGSGGPPGNPADDISFVPCPDDATGNPCVRVNVYREAGNKPLPTFFARLFGTTTQNVRATATAEVTAGNAVRCMLPFAIVDRWADNVEGPDPDPPYPNDTTIGVEGWTPNDHFQPGDTYIPAYSGNSSHTGWTMARDYGRQLVIQGDTTAIDPVGPFLVSTWARFVYLPGSQGGGTITGDFESCHVDPVGIATAVSPPCETGDAVDPLHGCLGQRLAPSSPPTPFSGLESAILEIVESDPLAFWDSTAQGPYPYAPTMCPQNPCGAVVGGKGMASPRIRPLAVVDIGQFGDDAACAGESCRVKVANIVGFFIEGLCGSVKARDGLPPPHMPCPVGNENAAVVGRLVTVPAMYRTGGGTVEQTAAFTRIVRLVR